MFYNNGLLFLVGHEIGVIIVMCVLKNLVSPVTATDSTIIII